MVFLDVYVQRINGSSECIDRQVIYMGIVAIDIKAQKSSLVQSA